MMFWATFAIHRLGIVFMCTVLLFHSALYLFCLLSVCANTSFSVCAGTSAEVLEILLSLVNSRDIIVNACYSRATWSIKSLTTAHHAYPAPARSARARRACALRALGLEIVPKVGNERSLRGLQTGH